MNYLINKKLNLLLFLAAILNLLIVLLFELPCPWKLNFNIDCAGCGVTRMVKALLKLDFYQAFRFNPLFFCLLITGSIYAIIALIFKIKKKEFRKLQSKDYIFLLVILLIYTILRNIPYFYFLKPTVVR